MMSITDSSRAPTPQRGPSTTPLPTFTRRLEQVMAESDTDAAYRRLNEAHRQLRRLTPFHAPSAPERRARTAGDDDEHHDLLTDRLVQACTAAATAIETALKALGSDARIDPRTLHSHDIARIVEELPPADAAAARPAILDGPVGSFGRVSVWRSLGDCLPDVDGPRPEELATPSFTLALASSTLGRVRWRAVEAVRSGRSTAPGRGRTVRPMPQINELGTLCL